MAIIFSIRPSIDRHLHFLLSNNWITTIHILIGKVWCKTYRVIMHTAIVEQFHRASIEIQKKWQDMRKSSRRSSSYYGKPTEDRTRRWQISFEMDGINSLAIRPISLQSLAWSCRSLVKCGWSKILSHWRGSMERSLSSNLAPARGPCGGKIDTGHSFEGDDKLFVCLFIWTKEWTWSTNHYDDISWDIAGG